MAIKEKTNFGKRLAHLRKAVGLTQKQLGDAINISRRMIVYYEGDAESPPANLVEPLAKALRVTPEELLGIKEPKSSFNTRNAALWRKLKLVEELPQKDQKAILHHIELAVRSKELNQKDIANK
jgi:transcriptional regulator with XRE-family HTH domain